MCYQTNHDHDDKTSPSPRKLKLKKHKPYKDVFGETSHGSNCYSAVKQLSKPTTTSRPSQRSHAFPMHSTTTMLSVAFQPCNNPATLLNQSNYNADADLTGGLKVVRQHWLLPLSTNLATTYPINPPKARDHDADQESPVSSTMSSALRNRNQELSSTSTPRSPFLLIANST